jgi:hypothetical protein
VTAPPNAELAYRVLDHIDAHPETWSQRHWCGTYQCFAGWAVELSGERADADQSINGVHVSDRAAQLLGFRSTDDLDNYTWTVHVENGGDCDEELFGALNTREDLGRLVAEIFGPRPPWTAVDEQTWRECAHRADYLTPAEHARECAYHRGEVDADGWPVDEPDEEHCGNNCGGVYEDGERVEEPDDCVCCECCCDCLACIYAPQDAMLLTAEQRAGIGAGLDDVPPNAGSAS